MNRIEESPDRALWSAVLLQVEDDISDAPRNSVTYADAEAFIRGDGAWARSRADIAACLNVHVDDIERGGWKWLAARHAREGWPPPSRPVPPDRRVARAPVAVMPNLPTIVVASQPAQKTKPRKTPGGLRHVFNPFNPLLQNRR